MKINSMSGYTCSRQLLQLCSREVGSVNQPFPSKLSRYPLRPWLLPTHRHLSKSVSRPFPSINSHAATRAEISTELSALQKHNEFIPFEGDSSPNTTQSSNSEPRMPHKFASVTSTPSPSVATQETSSKLVLFSGIVDDEPEIDLLDKRFRRTGFGRKRLDTKLPSTSIGDGVGSVISETHKEAEAGTERVKKPRTSLRKERRALARALQAQTSDDESTTTVAPVEENIVVSSPVHEAPDNSNKPDKSTKPNESSKPDKSIRPNESSKPDESDSSNIEPKAIAKQSVDNDSREPWQVQKAALKEKFNNQAWAPRKRLSPDTLESIRTLHAKDTTKFSTPALADYFEVSPDAIRRILKSKWRPSAEEEEDRSRRWDKRGQKVWTALTRKGIHPPKKWRDMGIGAGTRALRPGDRRKMPAFSQPTNRTSQKGFHPGKNKKHIGAITDS